MLKSIRLASSSSRVFKNRNKVQKANKLPIYIGGIKHGYGKFNTLTPEVVVYLQIK